VSDPLGRRALFSPPASGRVSPSQANGKESLYSASDISGDTPGPPGISGDTPGPPGTSADTPKPPGGARQWGTVVLDCSSCGTQRRVNWVEFAWRHLPFWLWIPWSRYSQLMACPACQRRTWVGVSFFS
jgi:hypothetical protein